MLTIVVPMTFENVEDWLEEHYSGSGYALQDGYIGQQLTESQLENMVPAMNDMSLICYMVGSLGYLCSTIVTVLILLCVGEIESDAGVEDFLRRVGSGSRIPCLGP